MTRGSSVVEYRTHNPIVAGAIPAPATNNAGNYRDVLARRSLLGVGGTSPPPCSNGKASELVGLKIAT